MHLLCTCSTIMRSCEHNGCWYILTNSNMNGEKDYTCTSMERPRTVLYRDQIQIYNHILLHIKHNRTRKTTYGTTKTPTSVSPTAPIPTSIVTAIAFCSPGINSSSCSLSLAASWPIAMLLL